MQNEKFFHGKTILITGGLGFMGSNLAIRLAELNPKKIILVDSLVSGLGGSLKNISELINNKIIDFQPEDIKNISKMKSLVTTADIIFNLAGSSKHTKLDEGELKFDNDVNFLSQVFFLESVRQVMIENPKKKLKMIFAGTRDQYGKVPYHDLPVKENYLPKDMTDYQSISKNSVENHHLLLNNIMKDLGIDLKINSLRISNTYGPRQSTNYGAVIPIFVEKSISGKSIELWGGGEVYRDLNYVDDVIDAFFLVASTEKEGQIYNLGCCVGKMDMQRKGIGNNFITIKELAETIVKISGKGEIKIIPYPPERKAIEPGHFAADISKIAELGWHPKISLEEGLRRTIEWNRRTKI